MEERTNLDLLRTDYTQILAEACKEFMAAAEAGAVQISRPDAVDQPALDRALVKMVVAERRIARLILPAPDAMEFFGLPRSITSHGLDPDPAVRIQDPAREGWDFRPWLSEKITYLRENLGALLETSEAMLEALQGDQEPAPMDTHGVEETLYQRLRGRAAFELRASRGYAKDILSAIESLGLTVVDWRIAGSAAEAGG